MIEANTIMMVMITVLESDIVLIYLWAAAES